MGFFEVIMIGFGLSMDAFAASVCKGLGMKKLKVKNMLIIGLFFGGFQALMPLLGWSLGKQFESYITNIDHWVAFVLLAFIGGKMIWDVIKSNGECECCVNEENLNIKEIFTLAVATSIDALAVGISFAFLKVKIAGAVTIIGVTTFVCSVAGVAIGNLFGAAYEKKATLAGGIILIFIGAKILLEDLGII